MIGAIRTGSETAFRSFYEQTHKRLYRFVFKHTQDRFLTEEIVQVAYVKLWEKRLDIEPTMATFKSYLFTIARNLVIKEYHRKIAEQEAYFLYKELQDPHQAPREDTQSLLKKIQQNVALLPKRQQQVFKLVKFEGLTYREVASELSISESTVEKHIINALQTLRKNLSKLAYLLPIFIIFLNVKLTLENRGTVVFKVHTIKSIIYESDFDPNHKTENKQLYESGTN